MLSLTIRRPKESEMTLSSQVKEATNQAALNLREALAFASRSEHPILVATLAELIVRVESLDSLDQAMATFMKGRDEVCEP
jgi:hypothetical protein